MNLKKKYSTTTAILLFAQSEKVEGSLKPFASCKKQNILLWKKMNGKVLKTIQKTQLSYFISNETNQVGSTFGEKITRAIQDIFAQGFEKVIVVGNDCIALNAKHLLQAEHDLQRNDLVIGADFSGGAYLIGLTKSKFKAEPFKTIPWQTKKVFSALQNLYNIQSIGFLPSLADCNSASDFKKAVYQLPHFSALKKILLSFLIVPKQQDKFESNFIVNHYYTTRFNKGSPIL
jgi:glycosyltransferase A (GT-A) superfamily protein (DUF2064 family)